MGAAAIGMMGGDLDVFDGGLGMASLMGLQGGGLGAEPTFIKNVLGSTLSGRPLSPGEILPDGTSLPRHGGTRDPSGLTMGWGADPSLPMIQDGWSDPLRGMAWPTNYQGEELVFDSNLNRYVIAKHNAQKAEHNIVKGATHMAQKTIGGPVVGGIVPAIGGGSLIGGTNVVHEVNKAGASGIPAIGASPVAAQSGHGLAKASIGQAASAVDRQTFGGVSRGDPFANQAAANIAQESLHVAKKTVGMASANTAAGGMGLGAATPLGIVNPGVPMMPVGNPVVHNIAKTSGFVGTIAAGKPDYGKTSRHVALSGVSAGTLGIDHPAAIAHNIGKATLGADAIVGHQIAKAASVPTGTGFINPGTMVGGAVLVGTPGMGMPIGAGGLMGRTNVVHEVNKAGASGIPSIGASPIAAQTGHLAAKASIGQAAGVVDRQTWGGVSRGDPMANQVAANLAQDSLHVAKKTVGMASANTAAINSGMPMGGAMIGGATMFGGPVKPIGGKGIVRPTGYGGRSRF